MHDDRRWATILSSTPDVDARWIRLPLNLRSTLVAYVAGPGRVQAELIRPGSRAVREVVTAPGVEPEHRTRPLTQEDVDGLYEDLVAYASSIQIPPPPAAYTWTLGVPPDMEADRFERALNVAQAEQTEPDPRRDAFTVARVVGALLGVPNPLEPPGQRG